MQKLTFPKLLNFGKDHKRSSFEVISCTMLVPENSSIVYGGIGIRGETECRIESEMHACVSFQPKSRIVGNPQWIE